MTETKEISLTIPVTSGFTHVLFNLAAQGYDYIKITYSGSGDSGCIDDVHLIKKGLINIEDDVVEDQSDYNNDYPDDDLRKLIENKAYKYVLNDADDWYNNDGGGGTLYISTLDGSYHSDHYVTVTETVDSVITGKFGDD